MIEGSLTGTLVRLVLSLAMVLALMVLLARYLRHRQLGVGVGSTQRRKKSLPLQVVSRQGLSRGSSLAVVRVSGQLLLLGVTEATVSVLRELEDVDPPEPDLPARSELASFEPATFGPASFGPATSGVSTSQVSSSQVSSSQVSSSQVSGSEVSSSELAGSPGLQRPSGGGGRSGSVVEKLRQWTVRRG